MNQFELTYGKTKIAMQMPEKAMLGDVIKPSLPPSTMTPVQIADAIRSGIEKPLVGEQLRELAKDKIVTILVNDEFRSGYQEELLHAAMEELSKAPPKRVTVICATGTHNPAVYAKNIERFAIEAADKAGLTISFIGHNCDDEKLVDVGHTPMGTPLAVEPAALEAEVLVFLHESKVHYMNGYSLPDKQILPGVSARKTVEGNHKRALDAENSVGGNSPYHTEPSFSNNPFGKDISDARKKVARLFMDENKKVIERDRTMFVIDMLSDTGFVHNVFSGPIDEVIEAVIPEIDKQTAFSIPPADCVVISPGGPPACNALYGVQNCFDLSLKGSIKPGGEALILAPCIGRDDLPEDVRGLAPGANAKVLFWDNLIRLMQMNIDDAERWIDENFELYLWKTDRVLKLVKRTGIKLYLYSELDPAKLEGSPFTPVTDPQAWIDERSARGASFNVVDSGNKVLVRGQ